MYLMTDYLAGYVVRAGAGAGPPLHVHDREDECFYVLDGELSICCGDDAFDAAAGSFVFAEITAAASDAGRRRNGERYGIRVVPG
jgi:mannose-6-phosphate isomerase-like protein (cupin superfamily)